MNYARFHEKFIMDGFFGEKWGEKVVGDVVSRLKRDGIEVSGQDNERRKTRNEKMVSGCRKKGQKSKGKTKKMS